MIGCCMPIQLPSYMGAVVMTGQAICSNLLHKQLHCEMQLLDYGADVHNPGLIIRQSPLRVAVCDLNMDSDLVELLVSRGASPFLEDVDGQSCSHTAQSSPLQVSNALLLTGVKAGTAAILYLRLTCLLHLT